MRKDDFIFNDRNCNLNKSVNIPIDLYESLKGEYFVGNADNLCFGRGTNAWVRLYNPPNSGVNLFVNVWTMVDISDAPFRAQMWFNATPPGMPMNSAFVTPANTAIYPPTRPKVKIQYASNIVGSPTNGVKAFERYGEPGTTLVESEDGKFIFSPGGSFLIFISITEDHNIRASGRVAFGWWEKEITDSCMDC